MNLENQKFGRALEALECGKMIGRNGWEGKGLRVFRQVPSMVPAEIIERMTSLPGSVKRYLQELGVPLRYSNQLAIIKPDGEINGWVPSVSDLLASDWVIYGEGYAVAQETVGTAKPL